MQFVRKIILTVGVFFSLQIASSTGQNTLENFEIRSNGVAYFNISTFGENAAYSNLS